MVFILYLSLQNLRQLTRTFLSHCLSFGALPTWTRWLAMALADTGGRVAFGGRCAAPRRRISDQLFLLEWVKFICAVVSSHLARLAASRGSIRWSAMPGSPLFSYTRRVVPQILLSCTVYTDGEHLWVWSSGLLLIAPGWNGCVPPQWTPRRGMNGMVFSVSTVNLFQSALRIVPPSLCWTVYDWKGKIGMDNEWSMLTVWKVP